MKIEEILSNSFLFALKALDQEILFLVTFAGDPTANEVFGIVLVNVLLRPTILPEPISSNLEVVVTVEPLPNQT